MLSSVACDDWFSIAYCKHVPIQNTNSLWDDNFWWIQMDGFACRIPLSVDMSVSIKLSSFCNEKQHSDPILMSLFHRSTKVRRIYHLHQRRSVWTSKRKTQQSALFICVRDCDELVTTLRCVHFLLQYQKRQRAFLFCFFLLSFQSRLQNAWVTVAVVVVMTIAASKYCLCAFKLMRSEVNDATTSMHTHTRAHNGAVKLFTRQKQRISMHITFCTRSARSIHFHYARILIPNKSRKIDDGKRETNWMPNWRAIYDRLLPSVSSRHANRFDTEWLRLVFVCAAISV